jgi:hypothetical protein
MRNIRSSRGQGLIEGACGTIIFTLVFVLLVAFAINFYTTMVAHEKLRMVATECARVIDGKQYWLGMKRPDPKGELAAATEESAKILARDLCAKLGLPDPTEVHYKVNTDLTDPGVTYTTCTVICDGIRLPYGFNKLFPGVLRISETGVAGDMAAEPYAVLYVDLPLDGKDSRGGALGGRGAMLLPLYGTASPEKIPSFGDHYRPGLMGGIQVGAIKGPFKAARVTIDPPGSVTQLSAQIAEYGSSGEWLRDSSISAFP